MKKTVSVSAFIVAFSAVAGLAVMSTACGDDDTTNPGTTTSSSSGTSGTSSSSGTSGTSSSGTSGTSGTPVTPKTFQDAACGRQAKCTPNAFKANYADAAECGKATGTGTAVEYPGLDKAFSYDKCATDYAALDCSDIALPASCSAVGTLADDAACNIGSQCKTGTCAEYDANLCGKCKAAPTPKAKGDACAAGDTCASGTYCDSAGEKKCVDYIAKDAACTLAQLAACAPGTTCTATATDAGKCEAIVGIDADCKATLAGSTCYFGLSCVDGKCKEPTYGAVGADCDAAAKPAKLCAKSACVSAKCVALAKDGEDCANDGTKPTCEAGLACPAAGGKCAKPADPNVCK